MISPVDFLNARYDEIQALAQRAGGRPWHVAHDAHDAYDPEDARCKAGECWHRRIEGDDITIYDEGGHDEDQAAHIAFHNPAAVLDDITSKRAIVESFAEVIRDRDLSRYGEFGALRDERHALAITIAVEGLRAFAAPFKLHPDYDPAWSVTE